jgi:hypothetical protein
MGVRSFVLATLFAAACGGSNHQSTPDGGGDGGTTGSDSGTPPQACSSYGFPAQPWPTIQFEPGAVAADFDGDGNVDVVSTESTGLGFTRGLGNGRFAAMAMTDTSAAYDRAFEPYAGDFNGDGKLDLAFANDVAPSAQTAVDIALGDGHGSFATPVHNYAGATMFQLAAGYGDLNHDGKLDAITANWDNNSISVLLGKGDGTLATHVDTAISSEAFSVAVGDVDGDTKLDVVVNTRAGYTLLLGNGSGGFAAPQDVALSVEHIGPTSLVDVNGDTKPDLIMATDSGSDVQVMLNTGSGFADPVGYNDANVGGALEVADVSGDGKPDLVLTAQIGTTFGKVAVLLGNGDGTFAAATTYETGYRSAGPAYSGVADVTGDGKADILSANGDGSLALLINHGDGTFPPARSDLPAMTDTRGVAAVDVDRDGKLDLVIADRFEDQISVWYGNGDGTYQPALDLDSESEPQQVRVADLDGDGKLDLVSVGPAEVGVLLANGTRTFARRRTFSAASGARGFALADITGDGKLDAIVADTTGGAIDLVPGNGDGTFGTAVPLAPATSPTSVIAVDVNGDGKLDLVATNLGQQNTASTISVLIAMGGGAFAAPVPYAVGATPLAVDAGDLDGNGTLDLVVANDDSPFVSVLGGNGDGTFGAAASLHAGVYPGFAHIADVNGDGKLDILVANQGANTISVLAGHGDLTFAQRADFPTADSPDQLATGDFDGDGRVDIAVTSSGSAVSLLFARCVP